jgi:hypothetical protein
MFRFVLQVQTARSSPAWLAMLSAGPCGRERQVMSHGALIKPLAYDWPLNRRAIGFISRSWSFLSNLSIAGSFVVLLVSPKRRRVLVKARMDIGNENDQVS